MSVVLHRLQQVAWSWHKGSIFRDHWGFPIDILQCPIQELRQRLTYACQTRIQQTLASRKTFAGMQWMSPSLTMHAFDKHDPEDRAILRTCLNGTFFTADRPVKAETAEDDSCKFCGQPDSQVHRHWQCPHFASQRKISPAQLDTLLTLPPSVLARGWMPEPPSLPAFKQACMSLPDTHQDLQWPWHTPPTLDVFTDGSCKQPTCPLSRVAGWGVVVGLKNSTFWPLSQGMVPGWIQTAMRAELTAAISACFYIYQGDKPARLWIDNATVFRRLKTFLQEDTIPVGPNKRDADLWNVLRQYAIAIGPDRLEALHVHSHQNLETLDVAEEWICTGNQQADALADAAIQQYPAVEHIWHTLQQDIVHIHTLRRVVHNTLLAVGKQAIRSQYTAPKTDKQYTSRLPAEVTETCFSSSSTEDLPTKYQFDGAQTILDWATSLSDHTAEPRFISWFQLNALYEHMTQQKGARHVLGKRQWVSGSQDLKHHNLVQRTNSLSSYLQGIAAQLDQPCKAYHVRPCSCTIQFWTQCVFIRLKDTLGDLADEILGASQPTFKSVQSLRCI